MDSCLNKEGESYSPLTKRITSLALIDVLFSFDYLMQVKISLFTLSIYMYKFLLRLAIGFIHLFMPVHLAPTSLPSFA